jgi:hypothetical protein
MFSRKFPQITQQPLFYQLNNLLNLSVKTIIPLILAVGCSQKPKAVATIEVLNSTPDYGLDPNQHYTPEHFKSLFESAAANYPNTTPPSSTQPIINPEVDKLAAQIALERGYKYRPVVANTDMLIGVDYASLQPTAAHGFQTMKNEAATAGNKLIAVSGYRSPKDQKEIFTGKLNDYSKTSLNKRLVTSSWPGMSRHHTGYTIDFICDSGTLENFENSHCYQWLADDNFANAKRHGFIPSYPVGAANQGPKPEAWEFVYIGTSTQIKQQ